MSHRNGIVGDGSHGGGVGVMDYNDVAVSHEGGSIFQKEKEDQRQHISVLERRQRKKVRIATP